MNTNQSVQQLHPRLWSHPIFLTRSAILLPVNAGEPPAALNGQPQKMNAGEELQECETYLFYNCHFIDHRGAGLKSG